MEHYRVLIVDDDEDLRALLAESLRPKFETVQAIDGLDALNRLADIQPDIAILDVEMPLLDGFQLCQAIRRSPDCSDIPIVFLSAHGEKDMIMKGYAAGANLFMLKPLDPIRFLRNLEMTVEQQRPALRKKLHTVDRLKEMAGAAPPVGGQGAPAPAAATPPPAPPKAASKPAAAAKKAEPEAPRAIPRVMIVDNEEDQRELINLSLRKEFEITTAHDGLDAVSKIVEYQPDILLIDIMMPRMNGYQLLQSIRRNSDFWKAGVIMVSAKSNPRDIEHAKKLGANDFIVKPYSTDDLLKRVRAVASAPGFQVRAKKIPISQIVEQEYLESKGREERENLDERKRKYAELQDIIDAESKKQSRKR